MRLTDLSARPPFSVWEAGEALGEPDQQLIEAARATLRRHHRPVWHMVAAALRGADGRIWTGLHLGATVGRLSVCAEAVALGRVVIEGGGVVDTVVAVRQPKPEERTDELAVVAPCGACREMFLDFSPEARVILPNGAGLLKLPVRALLPAPYRR